MAVKISAIAFDGTGAGLAGTDLFAYTDADDTTEAASGTTKKITFTELMKGIAANFATTITSTIGTISTSTPFFSGTVTWNANVNFESIVVNAITGADFGISSNLINLKRDGTSVFRVGGIDGSGNMGCVVLRLLHTGDEFILNTSGLFVGQSHKVRWSSTDFISGTVDTAIERAVAGRLKTSDGSGNPRDHEVRQLLTAASTTSRASISMPHGSAPTSPVDGDLWTTTAGLFVRINGATVGPLS